MLEDNRKLLGFSHFSLECDTLERVFLDLCARADNKSSNIKENADRVAVIEHIGKKYFIHYIVNKILLCNYKIK